MTRMLWEEMVVQTAQLMKGSSAARMGMGSRLVRWISAGMESTSWPEEKNAMMGTTGMEMDAVKTAKSSQGFCAE